MAIKPDGGTLNSLSTPSTGVQTNQQQQQQQQQTAPCDGVQRIRVDFKESHDIENVWEMGGLSVLTSVPITPRVLCFLCASSGNVEVRLPARFCSLIMSHRGLMLPRLIDC